MMELLIGLLLVCRPTIPDGPIAKTALGHIRGSLMTSRLGKTIYAFRGIPYAKPPVHDLRFQPPQPIVDPWNGTLDATRDGASCPPSETGANLPRSEDCLYLNVYSTKLQEPNSTHLRPVIVFFHPGAWYSFTSHSKVFGPQYLLDKDIVLVTANYRLGVLGFASTNNSDIQGNFGLKDQVAVLRWVKQNIAAFGGDPTSVTISGSGAGGASVMYHMVSPMSRGLFHRVIASSGSALSLWARTKFPVTNIKRFAELFGCPTETSQQIKDCLMKQDAQKMADSIFRLNEWNDAPGVIFGPVIETGNSSERFLVEYPIDSFISGRFAQVPVLTGITKDEFAWRSLRVLSNRTLAKEINANSDHVLPIVFDYQRGTPRSLKISKTLRNLYFQDRTIDNSTIDELAKMYRDGLIGYGQDLAAKALSKYGKAPIWFYRFSYQGRHSWVHKPDTKTPYGVVHLDDLIYLFCISVRFPCFNATGPDVHMVETLTTLWANFAKSGNPTPRKSESVQNDIWDPFTAKNLKYLDIGSHLEMKAGLYQDTLSVWENLFYAKL